mgnify:CR=1 FL=1
MEFTTLPAVRLGRLLVGAGALASTALTAHAAVNLRQVPHLRDAGQVIGERVSVLVPARNEAHRIAPTIRSLLGQRGIADLEIVVLDDGSTDGTAELVRSLAGDDHRLRVIEEPDSNPPPGWIGKPWACHRLSQAATGSVLVFIDADVELAPGAIAAAVGLLRAEGADLVSPVPRQLAHSSVERLTQPLLNWAWISLLPMALARHPGNGQWAVAVGQFIVVDASAYRAAGGHGLVRGHVVEDLTFAQEFKSRGHRTLPAIGADVAGCRMYTDARGVYEGYTKSLWSLFPTSFAVAGAIAGATVVFVLPAAAALTARDPRTRAWGAWGYATAVAGRALVAHRVGERSWPDALAHPASVAAMLSFAVASRARLGEDTLRWKGRRVVPD